MNLLRFFLLFLLAMPTEGQVFDCPIDDNTPVPRGLPGETFLSFDGEDLPFVSERCIAFRGEGTLGSEGIYLVRGGVVEVVADLNTAVPGGVRGLERFDEFEEAFALDDCDVVFDGTGDGGNGTGDVVTKGIYLKREGMPLEVVADSGTEAPEGTFSDFEDPWLEGGMIVFIATTSGGGCDTGAIFKTDGQGGFVVVADSCGGTPVPSGLPGETFSNLETRPVLEDDVLTFRGMGDGTPPTSGIYAEIEGGLMRVVDSWTPIPDGEGTVFNQFFEIAPTSLGEIVFLAAGPESMPPFSFAGIYRWAPQGMTRLVDLIDTSVLPGWDPGDPITGFGFWYSGGLLTFGAQGDTSPETIFLLRNGNISRLLTAGDPLQEMTVSSFPIAFPHCTTERVVLIPRFQHEGGVQTKLCVAKLPLFRDGFESGDTMEWSMTVP